jgi:adenosylmethionine-8-amino-7-oxononanoate aminotransferase
MTKRFMVDGLPIHVASAGFYVPSGSSSVEHASRLIRKVADLFDQELATGAYDAFFTSELE